MKEQLFVLLEEKRELIKKLQREYYILLNIYHSIPNDEGIGSIESYLPSEHVLDCFKYSQNKGINEI